MGYQVNNAIFLLPLQTILSKRQEKMIVQRVLFEAPVTLRYIFISTPVCCVLLQAQDRLDAETIKPKVAKVQPNTNYRDKYKHLIGDTAAKDAAQSTVTNRSYGFGKNMYLLYFR